MVLLSKNRSPKHVAHKKPLLILGATSLLAGAALLGLAVACCSVLGGLPVVALRAQSVAKTTNITEDIAPEGSVNLLFA